MALRIHAPIGNPRAARVVVAGALANVQIEVVDTPYDQLKKKEFLAKYSSISLKDNLKEPEWQSSGARDP